MQKRKGEQMTEAFPLSWPIHWPRTPPYKRSNPNFKSMFGREINVIKNEVQLLVGRYANSSLVISTNQPLRKDGYPMASYKISEDPGVAVYFMKNQKQVCIPCDKWVKIEDNLRAVGKTIEAIRGIERWGAKETVDAAFQGFEALPPGTGKTENVMVQKVDYFGGFTSVEAVQLRYKTLVKKLHPDLGGNQEEFQDMQAQYEKLRVKHGIN